MKKNSKQIIIKDIKKGDEVIETETISGENEYISSSRTIDNSYIALAGSMTIKIYEQLEK